MTSGGLFMYAPLRMRRFQYIIFVALLSLFFNPGDVFACSFMSDRELYGGELMEVLGPFLGLLGVTFVLCLYSFFAKRTHEKWRRLKKIFLILMYGITLLLLLVSVVYLYGEITYGQSELILEDGLCGGWSDQTYRGWFGELSDMYGISAKIFYVLIPIVRLLILITAIVNVVFVHRLYKKTAVTLR